MKEINFCSIQPMTPVKTSAIQMDAEVLWLVGGYHVHVSGLQILNDVGVVVAPGFLDIDDANLTGYGMNLLDRKKAGKIRERLQGNV